jgi:alpha-tubulin suppressor-like RCC1 family protein
MGQLGNGTREYKEKLRFTSGFSHRIIQVSAGCSHVVALTREGNVIAWGGNRKGQLGDGQFTSSCEAKVIVELRHRPVVLITCGEEHSLALTSGGNVYSWGDNSQGQLGLGDCKVGKAEYLDDTTRE